jgi:hypothetical protein
VGFALITMHHPHYIYTSNATTTKKLISIVLITESASLPNIEVGVPKMTAG